jgi:hypothetical protein
MEQLEISDLLEQVQKEILVLLELMVQKEYWNRRGSR